MFRFPFRTTCTDLMVGRRDFREIRDAVEGGHSRERHRHGAVRDLGRRQPDLVSATDDLVAGVMVMRAEGEHLGIDHIGTTEEFTIGDVARRIAAHAGRDIELVHFTGAARRHLLAPPLDTAKL